MKTTSSQELSEWRIHLRKHPPWWIRIEAAIAQLCCLYYNSHRARGVPAAKIIDFMLFRDKPKGFTKPRQQQRVFKLLAAMNAKLAALGLEVSRRA